MRLLIAVLLGLSALMAHAQYPSKPVRLVVPFPAGGIVDIVARAVSEKMSANWGQPIVVESRPGANASIGTDSVAKSAPDGYTWLLATLNHVTSVSLQKNLPWHPTADFAGASALAVIPALAVVPASLPVNSLRELVAYSKAQPGKLNYMMPGTGTSMHLNTELLRLTAGLDVTAVPYKGLAPAVPDLLSGTLAFGFVSVPLVAPHIKSGRIRALAIGAPRRIAQFPDVPTIAEAGFPEAQLTSMFWILVPARTPRETILRINQEAEKALADPEVIRRLESAGADLVGPMAPQDIDALLRSETSRWAKFVKDARIESQ